MSIKTVARKVSDVGYDSDDYMLLIRPVMKVAPKDEQNTKTQTLLIHTER